MSFVISSVLPFPNIEWWCKVMDADLVRYDIAEHFLKMTYRNRYYMASANGVVTLSIPMQHGRDHKMDMKDAAISYDQNWQLQHWRTLVSAYNRSPYFEFYASSLENLFTKNFKNLVDFNIASIHWIKQQTQLNFKEEVIDSYQKEYRDALFDLRNLKLKAAENNYNKFPEYFQVFGDRIGFQANLSMLDLLFAEGPYALKWLKENKEMINNF